MKIYLLATLFGLILIFAVIVYVYYKERLNVYKDLKYICGVLSRNINFKKSTIEEILKSEFSKVSLITKYILKNKTSTIKILGKENSEIVYKFFESLGEGDVGYELNYIDYYKSEFESLEACAKDDLQKKGLVYFKLIIGFGLMACIILL